MKTLTAIVLLLSFHLPLHAAAKRSCRFALESSIVCVALSGLLGFSGCASTGGDVDVHPELGFSGESRTRVARVRGFYDTNAAVFKIDSFPGAQLTVTETTNDKTETVSRKLIVSEGLYQMDVASVEESWDETVANLYSKKITVRMVTLPEVASQISLNPEQMKFSPGGANILANMNQVSAANGFTGPYDQILLVFGDFTPTELSEFNTFGKQFVNVGDQRLMRIFVNPIFQLGQQVGNLSLQIWFSESAGPAAGPQTLDSELEQIR